jgi:hypothetical protein
MATRPGQVLLAVRGQPGRGEHRDDHPVAVLRTVFTILSGLLVVTSIVAGGMAGGCLTANWPPFGRLLKPPPACGAT